MAECSTETKRSDLIGRIYWIAQESPNSTSAPGPLVARAAGCWRKSGAEPPAAFRRLFSTAVARCSNGTRRSTACLGGAKRLKERLCLQKVGVKVILLHHFRGKPAHRVDEGMDFRKPRVNRTLCVRLRKGSARRRLFAHCQQLTFPAIEGIWIPKYDAMCH